MLAKLHDRITCVSKYSMWWSKPISLLSIDSHCWLVTVLMVGWSHNSQVVLLVAGKKPVRFSCCLKAESCVWRWLNSLVSFAVYDGIEWDAVHILLTFSCMSLRCHVIFSNLILEVIYINCWDQQGPLYFAFKLERAESISSGSTKFGI